MWVWAEGWGWVAAVVGGLAVVLPSLLHWDSRRVTLTSTASERLRTRGQKNQ